MNRRGFLTFLGVGLPAAVVAEKVGLIEQVRTYFFAPKMGWEYPLLPNLTTTQTVALQLEAMRKFMPTLYESDAALHTRFIDGIQYRQKQTSTGEWHGLARGPYPQIEWDKALEI